MVVFPVIAALVSGVFSSLLLRQFGRKRRVSQLAWGVAMAMYAAASLAVAAGVAGGWRPTTYRIFYLFGAMLNVPWLALGSVALLGKKALTWVALVGTILLSGWGFGSIVSSGVCRQTVQVRNDVVCAARGTPGAAPVFGYPDIPGGKRVWAQDGGPRALAIWFSTVAFVLVVGIAIVSSRARNGVAPPESRRRANLLIAAGVTIVAVGSTALVERAQGSAFSITLAAGVTVMFAGFVLASRAPRHRVVDPGDSPT